MTFNSCTRGPAFGRHAAKSIRTTFQLGALVAALGACNGAASPSAEGAKLGADYTAAVANESNDSGTATKYLDALDRAVRVPDSPDALPAALAALDALIWAPAAGFEQMPGSAVAYRSPEAMRETIKRLEKAWAAAEPGDHPAIGAPFIRGYIALALHEIALYSGDLRAADLWGSRRGCARQAAVIGPFDWTALVGIEGPSPVASTGPLSETYAGVAPFAARITPTILHSDACEIDANATSFLQGTRAVVVDIDSPRAQRASLSLSTNSAAVLEIGGQKAIVRAFHAGGHSVTRMATVDVPEGITRVVIRVAHRGESSRVELNIWGENGLPLAMKAPRKGDVAKGVASNAKPVLVPTPAPGSEDERALAAAALVALGETRQAEHLLEPLPGQAVTSRSPTVDLVYVRAVELADDEPENKGNERERAAIDRVLAAWPNHWEARVGRARAIERRKGASEGGAEALRYLETAQDKDKETHDRMVAAYAALLAKRMGLLDVAEAAFAEVGAVAKGSYLLGSMNARMHVHSGADFVKSACDGATDRSEPTCVEAKREVGDYDAALDEIARVRQLRDAPDALRDAEMEIKMTTGDTKGALAVYESMRAPERRMLDGIGLAVGTGQKDVAIQRLRRDRTTARDAPYGIATVLRALGVEVDKVPALEAAGAKLVEQDRASAFLPGAATAVLRHTEEYTIESTGLIHYQSYDLRRVSGTTDVAAGTSAYGPSIEGRSSMRQLRKRIHKRDGRILEPDSAQNSSQSSDLSQLEQGDYVEQIAEGWGLPGEIGQLVIDTPDLLPERTSIREGTIEIRRAAEIPFAVWSHPLLGKAEEKTDGGMKVSTWKLTNQPPRRIEDGVPRMDRSVCVSMGTLTWAHVGRALTENLRSMDDEDPIVKRWVDEKITGDRTPSKDLVARVVTAAGKTVKVAHGGDLNDASAVFGTGPQRSNIRYNLEMGQGSRSWVIYRALRELGIKSDIAVAENEPFSASPDFPAHAGRFRRPLVVAHLGAAGGDVWIDADVEGPPLPAGRISPELRGRTAMMAGGQTLTVEGSSSDQGSEVDVRLAVDAKGDAKGNFTILLHGREAQALADSLEVIVGSDRRELLRQVVLAWLPWADVDDVSVSSTEGSWEVALRASIAINGYGRPEGKGGKTWTLAGLEPVHEALPKTYIGTLASTYASRGARQNALSIDRPVQYHLHRVVELPPGATIARPPPLVSVTEARLGASRKIAVSGTTVTEDFTLSLPTGMVPADQYQSFVDRVQTVDDGFMAGTRIQLGGVGGTGSAAPGAPAKP